jgi:hypothetical protein
MLNAFSQPRKAVITLCLFLTPAFAQVHIHAIHIHAIRALAIRPPRVFSAALVQFTDKKGDVFNILWVLVFGFATLNILGLVARRFEPRHNRFSFGEALAVMVVVMSVGLLGYELLTVFKIFPIKLNPR